MDPIKPPAPHPCGSCPYRRDVPSGVWSEDEYDKLPEYDEATGEQPPLMFMCHQADGHACAGWVGCHDMDENLALRLASLNGTIADPAPFLDYETAVPLWDSGSEAASHGVENLFDPDEAAQKVMAKLRAKRGEDLEFDDAD